MTNGLILAAIDCSGNRSSAIKASFSNCVQQFTRNFREHLKEQDEEEETTKDKVKEDMALVFRFPTYHPIW